MHHKHDSMRDEAVLCDVTEINGFLTVLMCSSDQGFD